MGIPVDCDMYQSVKLEVPWWLANTPLFDKEVNIVEGDTLKLVLRCEYPFANIGCWLEIWW